MWDERYGISESKALNFLTLVQFHSNQQRCNGLDARMQGRFLKGSFLASKMDTVAFLETGLGVSLVRGLLPISVLVYVISCKSGLGQRDLRRLLGDLKTAAAPTSPS